MSHSVKFLSCVCVALAAAGCNSSMQTMTAGGTLSPALSIEPAISAADIATFKSMSRAQQLAHLAIADSMEIAMAEIATRRSQHPEIVDFARRMVDDHRQSLQRAHMIARHQNFALQPASNDTMPARFSKMVEAFSAGTPATEFDGTYMLSQIEFHQRALDELQALQSIVTDAAVRQHIDDDIPMVDAHLASARRISAKLGYTTYTQR